MTLSMYFGQKLLRTARFSVGPPPSAFVGLTGRRVVDPLFFSVPVPSKLESRDNDKERREREIREGSERNKKAFDE